MSGVLPEVPQSRYSKSYVVYGEVSLLGFNGSHRGPPKVFHLFPRGRVIGLHRVSRMKSATRSPIIIVVTLVLALMQSGMMDASATRRPSSP